MVREWYMRRGLRLLMQEWASGEVNRPLYGNQLLLWCAVISKPQFHSLQNIHQRLLDFVVTCR